MSEDVKDALSRFTPAAIDRDAVLFAAGRAAGRSSRWWKWLAAGLLLSNAVTLTVLFWPRPAIAPPPPVEPTPYTEPTEPFRPDPSSYIALRNGFDTPPPAGDPGPIRPSTPLTPRAINDPLFN